MSSRNSMNKNGPSKQALASITNKKTAPKPGAVSIHQRMD